LIREPGDTPAPDRADLFAALFPGNPAPAFNDAHSLMAVLAQSPKLALPAARLSAAVILDSAWGQRAGLRELAFQTLGHHFGDSFSTTARRPNAESAGLTADQLAAIPDWRNSALFDDEQKLVIEYTQAVVTGQVTGKLFARVVARYGEREAIECTAAIGFWSFWAMISGAVGL
jgi:alkylhydroperoxidase family enzyme